MQDVDDSALEETAEWWTPAGWIQKPPPRPLHEIYRTSWFEPEGYQVLETMSDAVEIWGYDFWLHRHTEDGHIMGCYFDGKVAFGHFFVAPEHEAAFWMEKLPVMIQAQIGPTLVVLLKRLLTTLNNFVRFGHGTDTVDSNSWRGHEELVAQDSRKEHD
jgi:hypothetical protein